MSVAILGAGAFGTALAIALAHTGPVILWGRDEKAIEATRESGESTKLPGVATNVPGLSLTSDLDSALACDTILLAMPMQSLSPMLNTMQSDLAGKALVACCKGIDLTSLRGPSAVIADAKPHAVPAVLTGPSFAADIARGLPTALTLACANEPTGQTLQQQLSTPTLRLYRTTDTIGAELGGALKNVIAIACGACIGAGLGDSARAALMTRGLAEMTRLALSRGAQPETLSGLSGFGDLVLTCGSEQSRNFRYGASLGRGDSFDPTVTVEGRTTAEAVVHLADREGIDLPISRAVHAIATGKMTIDHAMQDLLNRPLKEEQTC